VLFCSVAPKPKHVGNLYIQRMMQSTNWVNSFKKVIHKVYSRMFCKS
jgi:hypothetical protein